MRKTYQIIRFGICMIIVALLLVLFLYKTAAKLIVGKHQKGVVLELIEWQDEFEKIDSREQAIHAIDMYEYITIYYPPGEGYFHSEKMSMKLEGQRKQTLDTIIKSLEEYTELRYGHEIVKWKNWAENLKVAN